ncbi:MAG: MarR family transcriptional regulator [Hamadaea sp.]|uniref:MarR family winged helix-turn-helix transcriptional regulator n=1 Tax=Hamadaea sp. TaxID=2024425 RepID=UPI0017984444|nr:MarR family transcriptional regulator [Hamadaea sp.]NUR71768.1 MarR family transcriptional regulator [Hamadaea sp.]NUT19082.1 MarR family transcriptional regulator [Hamadaea sp.]
MSTPDRVDERDAADHHAARWADYLRDNPAFSPQVEAAMIRMGHILRRMRRDDVAAFAGSEFTIEDYKTLHALMVDSYPHEATPGQLAEATAVTRAAMTSRLDRLEKAGLVTRESEPTDRRRILIRPTPAGRTVWEHHLTEGLERENKLLSALTEKELVQLNTLLRKVMLSLDE